MALQSAPYYWLTCDGPDCGIKSTEGSEHSAWMDHGQAVDQATDSEWWIGDHGATYCPEHAPKCPTCGLLLNDDRTCEDADDAEHKEGTP